MPFIMAVIKVDRRWLRGIDFCCCQRETTVIIRFSSDRCKSFLLRSVWLTFFKRSDFSAIWPLRRVVTFPESIISVLKTQSGNPCDCLVAYIFMPAPFKEWWRGIKCYPCPFVRPCVRPSVIKMWCPLNNFWKTASIQFKFGMLMYNIKTQVEFDLGYEYNPLVLTEL